MINIQKAYKDAVEEAENEDITLQKKKDVIEEHMDSVKGKMKQIKENANQIQAEITEKLETVLAEMNIMVKDKADTLQCDR